MIISREQFDEVKKFILSEFYNQILDFGKEGKPDDQDALLKIEGAEMVIDYLKDNIPYSDYVQEVIS